MIISILKMKKLTHKEITLLVQRHIANMYQSRNSNLGNLTPELLKAMGLFGIDKETGLRRRRTEPSHTVFQVFLPLQTQRKIRHSLSRSPV